MCCAVPLQLGFHAKPIGLLNAEGFYNPLLACFKHLVDEVISLQSSGSYEQCP
jgi:predicted Rossmann-fold nucleotide-binding protein